MNWIKNLINRIKLEIRYRKKLKELRHSTFGILEPKKIIPFPKKKIEIFFIPGKKFDKEGNRKGRGKGYFDRFLKDIKGKKPIIGLCYKNQIVAKLDINPWDIPMDKIITLKG